MPRFQATALADNDDNLWVFGGSPIDKDKHGMGVTFLNLKVLTYILRAHGQAEWHHATNHIGFLLTIPTKIMI